MAEPLAFRPPKLGIGMVYSAALRPHLQRRPKSLDYLEIEPQTLWLADHAFEGPFYEFSPGVDLFAALPGHKLIHSVGSPLGGTRPPDPAQTKLLKNSAERLDSPWVSEHLSFAGTRSHAAGFLLPPLQTEAGVEVATDNIQAFRDGVSRPVAVETGVAYFKRKPFEMPDGDFLAAIVDTADCGILLDLHNIYCNERNGRMSIDEFLAAIPLDRVWEVHLAGGNTRDGYWLDSHNGPMPDELAARVPDIVKSLPNLGAITFEIYDTFLERIEVATFDRIVEQLREIWDDVEQCESGSDDPTTPNQRCIASTSDTSNAPQPEEWENSVTRSVWRNDPASHPWPEDRRPLALYANLARSFRGAMLTRALPRSIRYLLLRDGSQVDGLLAAYFNNVDPKLYTPLEAAAFDDWLREAGEDDALLLSLLDFDRAFLRIVREGKAQLVTFPGNPAPIFAALAEARLPDPPAPPVWEMEILPDSFSIVDFSSSQTVS